MLIFIACIISLSLNVYATETANKEGNEVLKNETTSKLIELKDIKQEEKHLKLLLLRYKNKYLFLI